MAVSAAPDGSWLGTADTAGVVRVWDPATGAALTSLRVAGRLSHLATVATTIATAGEHGPYFLTLRPGTHSAPTRTDMAHHAGVPIADTSTDERTGERASHG